MAALGCNERKHSRKSFLRTAIAELAPGICHEVLLLDISNGGARLQTGAGLPDTFLLRLSTDGNVVRLCKVAWRQIGEVGVRFAARRSE